MNLAAMSTKKMVAGQKQEKIDLCVEISVKKKMEVFYDSFYTQ